MTLTQRACDTTNMTWARHCSLVTFCTVRHYVNAKPIAN